MAETSGRRGDYTQDVSSHNIYMEMRSAPGTLILSSSGPGQGQVRVRKVRVKLGPKNSSSKILA